MAQSARLDTRQIVREFLQRFLNLESSFLTTLVGLTVRPGTVCSEYVEGKRKRYTNPFAYFLFAVAVDLFLTGMGGSETAVPAGDEPPDFALKYFGQIVLLCLIPLAFLWSKLFRRAGRNLAENYVFSLFTFGQFIWYEVLLLGPLALVISSETAIGLIYLLLMAVYFVYAGTVFYREQVHFVFLKYLVSLAIMVVAAILLRIVLLPVWPADFEGIDSGARP